jgi:hypothetical protein
MRTASSAAISSMASAGPVVLPGELLGRVREELP